MTLAEVSIIQLTSLPIHTGNRLSKVEEPILALEFLSTTPAPCMFLSHHGVMPDQSHATHRLANCI